ncbi:MAG: type II toxin-antitoxin system VapC family toxin [Eggerthellaceae bacterium]|nr:type II toxin-antitoxin system VapC family toxin [Eggerthellaceae bacterium]
MEVLTRSIVGCVNEFVPDEELLDEALAEAVWLDHPLYDMLYYVLAHRTAASLLTCDRCLARLCERIGVAHIAFVEL